jgi:AhpC/TSA family
VGDEHGFAPLELSQLVPSSLPLRLCKVSLRVSIKRGFRSYGYVGRAQHTGGENMKSLEGQKAPAFSLAGNDGNKHSLDEFKGKTVVLYFYPKDSTPG